MKIKYDLTPNGKRWRAKALGTNSYPGVNPKNRPGMEYRAWGLTKAEAKANLLKRLPVK